MQKSASNSTSRKACAIVAVCLLLVAVLASVVLGVNTTDAKYVVTVSDYVPFEVYSDELYISPADAVAWLNSNMLNSSSKLGQYWQTRLNSVSVLDSTGGNFGVYVCDEMVAAFGLEHVNFSFCVSHYYKIVDGVHVDYFDIYYVNNYVANLDVKTILTDVYLYKPETDVWTIGTAPLLTKFVSVNGVNCLLNYIDIDHYEVVSVLDEGGVL